MKEKPDVVFHLAAQAEVSNSIDDPEYDASVNINGKKFIFASTSGVYGSLQKELITEDDVTIPISYYDLSKLTAEPYIRLFYKFYGLSYTILRYGIVYESRQSAKGEGGVIAVFLDRIKNRIPLSIMETEKKHGILYM